MRKILLAAAYAGMFVRGALATTPEMRWSRVLSDIAAMDAPSVRALWKPCALTIP